MKINLTTQTEILTIKDEDLVNDGTGYLYEYFKQELEKNPTITNIKTLAYNGDNESGKLVLLIFDNGVFTQKEISLA